VLPRPPPATQLGAAGPRGPLPRPAPGHAGERAPP
ncbi:MAG: hypothetical protein AVDCRST_MAG73-2009, partial [uncultured Thermomicrobiales bacterium]